jgi:hypothetical protein
MGRTLCGIFGVGFYLTALGGRPMPTEQLEILRKEILLIGQQNFEMSQANFWAKIIIYNVYQNSGGRFPTRPPFRNHLDVVGRYGRFI